MRSSPGRRVQLRVRGRPAHDDRRAPDHRVQHGTVTVHVNAADVPAAQAALEEISHEDFDIDLTTRDGYVIGHITLGDADGAELVSIDDVPADELPDDDMH
ncbi:hypothetical protein [Streptomyces sp. PT19]|uniref:hypothetical protein n=1 Tax=Streptomyces sp. PT19 TaxID=3452239 RepID=UPI003F7F99EF